MDWTPPPRRSSSSRRTQNLALLGAVLTGAVIATGLLLLLVSRANPEAGARLRGTALDAVTPLWQIVRAPFDVAGEAVARVGDYVDAAHENRVLRETVRRQQAVLLRDRALAVENRRLRGLLAVRDPRRRTVVTARVAAGSTGAYVRSAVIAAGRRDGVRPGQPVRAAAGLVGRIGDSGEGAARLLLLTDPSSRVPVVIERTGQAALVVGVNAPLLQVRDRVGIEVPLQRGDRLVTSGDGGIFPPGLPVAVVVRPGGEPPLARPLANPVALGYVVVETPYLPPPAPPPATAAPVAAGSGVPQ